MSESSKAVYSRLNSQIAGLSGRIYPVTMPQDVTLPAISYRRVSVTRETAMGSDPGIVRARYEISYWASSYAATRTGAESVRSALQRWRGTESSVTIHDSFYINEVDLYDDETGFYRAVLDYEIIHGE